MAVSNKRWIQRVVESVTLLNELWRPVAQSGLFVYVAVIV